MLNEQQCEYLIQTPHRPRCSAAMCRSSHHSESAPVASQFPSVAAHSCALLLRSRFPSPPLRRGVSQGGPHQQADRPPRREVWAPGVLFPRLFRQEGGAGGPGRQQVQVFAVVHASRPGSTQLATLLPLLASSAPPGRCPPSAHPAVHLCSCWGLVLHGLAFCFSSFIAWS